MVNGESGIGTYQYNGITEVMAYSPVDNTDGWTIGVAVVRNEFLTVFYFSIIITILLLLISAAIAVAYGKNVGIALAKPIEESTFFKCSN